MAFKEAEAFFAALERSDLLSADELANARSLCEGTEDASEVAKLLARHGVLTRWQAGQLLAGRTSFHLGKYQLIDLLGRGGMGSVFLGRHVMMNRSVALKIVAKDVASDPAKMDQFLAEARAIAALDHPAIVQAYSVDNEGDRYYIVMEYIDGRDLQRVVEEEGRLDWRQAAEYIRQAADGLAHAHGRGLIHCDIKPSNLLVNQQGQVKILDMGLARLGREKERDESGLPNAREMLSGGQTASNGGARAAGDNTATAGTKFLGSVDYLAPEQALETAEFDHRADIYSLGCTLYFLLMGHPPFPEGTLPQKLLGHQTRQPRPIPTECEDVPPQLVQVCRRMMAKEPDERFQDAADVADTLGELVANAAPTDATGTAAAAGFPVVVDPGATSGGATAVHTAGGSRLRPEAGLGMSSKTLASIVAGGALLLLIVGTAIGVLAIQLSSPREPQDDEPVAEASREVDQDDADAPTPAPRDEPIATDNDRPGANGGDEDSPADGDLEDNLGAIAGIDSDNHATPTSQSPNENDTADDAPDQVPPRPEDAFPTDGEPEPQTPPEQQPPEQQPPEQQPPEQQPPERQPPDEEPAEKRPPKPPPSKPLENLASRITLPEGRPPSGIENLGKPEVPEGADLSFALHGGDTAIKGSRQFALADQSANGRPLWLLQLESPSSDDTVAVARLGVSQSEGELKIQWLPGAKQPNIGALCNCALSATCRDETAWIRFGQPREVEPIRVDWLQPKSYMNLSIDDMPEPNSLRLQITGVQAKGPKARFHPEGKDTSEPGKAVQIRIGAAEAPRVEMHLEFIVRGRTVRMEQILLYALQGMEQPQPLRLAQLSTINNQLAAYRKRLGEQRKKVGKNQVLASQVDEEIKLVDAQLKQMGELKELLTQLGEGTSLQYRLFTLADDHEVDLMVATAPTEPPADAEE